MTHARSLVNNIHFSKIWILDGNKLSSVSFSLPRRGVSLARTRKRFPSAGVRSRSLPRESPRVTGPPLFPRRCTLSARSPEDSEITGGKTRRERANLFLSRARALTFVRVVCDCVLTVPEEETTNRRRENEVSSFVSLFCSCLSVLLLLLLLFLLSIGSNIDVDVLLRRLRVFRAR